MVRIGIDLGGTKIAGVALRGDGTVSSELRTATPRDDYAATIEAIASLVDQLAEREGIPERVPGALTVGVAIPGAPAPKTGLIQNANSTWLNGQPFGADLEAHLGLSVRLANDANCFALSEAHDGAAAAAKRVFGVIIGTGCGGGIVHEGKLIDGPRGIGGEWGHNPLPWPTADEVPGPRCWCGRHGCLEVWVSGTGLAADHARVTGEAIRGEEIVGRAGSGDAAAAATLDRHANRLARALATVVNLIDPDVIVLGGGLSKLTHLYDELPRAMAPYIFAADTAVEVRRPKWGDASGVRGAARLFDGG